ncbi:hypothetical protein ACFWMU_08275 [Streptomyces sp. NPDC058357]
MAGFFGANAAGTCTAFSSARATDDTARRRRVVAQWATLLERELG